MPQKTIPKKILLLNKQNSHKFNFFIYPFLSEIPIEQQKAAYDFVEATYQQLEIAQQNLLKTRVVTWPFALTEINVSPRTIEIFCENFPQQLGQTIYEKMVQNQIIFTSITRSKFWFNQEQVKNVGKFFRTKINHVISNVFTSKLTRLSTLSENFNDRKTQLISQIMKSTNLTQDEINQQVDLFAKFLCRSWQFEILEMKYNTNNFTIEVEMINANVSSIIKAIFSEIKNSENQAKIDDYQHKLNKIIDIVLKSMTKNSKDEKKFNRQKLSTVCYKKLEAIILDSSANEHSDSVPINQQPKVAELNEFEIDLVKEFKICFRLWKLKQRNRANGFDLISELHVDKKLLSRFQSKERYFLQFINNPHVIELLTLFQTEAILQIESVFQTELYQNLIRKKIWEIKKIDSDYVLENIDQLIDERFWEYGPIDFVKLFEFKQKLFLEANFSQALQLYDVKSKQTLLTILDKAETFLEVEAHAKNFLNHYQTIISKINQSHPHYHQYYENYQALNAYYQALWNYNNYKDKLINNVINIYGTTHNTVVSPWTIGEHQKHKILPIFRWITNNNEDKQSLSKIKVPKTNIATGDDKNTTTTALTQQTVTINQLKHDDYTESDDVCQQKKKVKIKTHGVADKSKIKKVKQKKSKKSSLANEGLETMEQNLKATTTSQNIVESTAPANDIFNTYIETIAQLDEATAAIEEAWYIKEISKNLIYCDQENLVAKITQRLAMLESQKSNDVYPVSVIWNQEKKQINVDKKIYALKRSRTKDHELGRPVIILTALNSNTNEMLVLPGTSKRPTTVDIMIVINNIPTFFNFKSITIVDKTAILNEWRNYENNESFFLTDEQSQTINNNIWKYIKAIKQDDEKENTDLIALADTEIAMQQPSLKKQSNYLEPSQINQLNENHEFIDYE